MVVHQIGVIGSGNITENDSNYLIAEKLGKFLIDEGYRILCGGLKGIMEAVCKGAKSSSSYREGLTTGILPTLDPNTANEYVDIRIATGFSFGRNQIIVASSDAIIVIGGGAGTLSEIAFSWQMNKPIISLETTGGWAQKLAGKKIDKKRKDKILQSTNPKDTIKILNQILFDNE